MKIDVNKFKGVFVAMYSAYDDEGTISRERAKKLAKYYVDKGVKGLYVGGSSGEGVLQTEAERKAVLEAVMEEVGDEMTIIAHIGANSTEESVRLAKHAEQCGVAAISSIPAVYYRLPVDSVRKHWNEMIESVDLPFIIYHIPQTTGFNLPITLFEEMAKKDKVIGIKCSSESVFELQQFKVVGGKDFIVFNGPDKQFLAGRVMGATGGIGGTYGVMPELFVRLDDYIRKNELEKAFDLQVRINSFVKRLSATGSLYGSAKYILSLRGVETGQPRLPILPIESDAHKADLKKLNEEILQEVNQSES